MKGLMQKKNQKGFTLVELIIVIAIIGILVAIAIPKLTEFRNGAENKRVESEHRMLIGVIQTWQSMQEDPTEFPSSIDDIKGYIDGGIEALYKKKGETNSVHSIEKDKLTSTIPFPADDKNTTLTYPQD